MKSKLILLTALTLVIVTLCNGQENWDTLLLDGFDHGSMDNWVIGSAWAINHAGDNYFLTVTQERKIIRME